MVDGFCEGSFDPYPADALWSLTIQLYQHIQENTINHVQ
jgi:hypothetical protein